MIPISAVLISKDEEKYIERSLNSVAWADEIVVVDSFSTDRTVDICRHYTDRVIQRPWAGYRDQKAFAHSQASKEWVFLVHADERVMPELRDELRDVLNRSRGKFGVFSVPRLIFYLSARECKSTCT